VSGRRGSGRKSVLTREQHAPATRWSFLRLGLPHFQKCLQLAASHRTFPCATVRLGILCLILSLNYCAVYAQYPRSQHGTVTQHILGTEIGISYNRPVARGRELFGTLVHLGRIWHPGADSVSTISFSKDVTIDGHALAAGPLLAVDHSGSAAQAWTVIFNRGLGGWHTISGRIAGRAAA